MLVQQALHQRLLALSPQFVEVINDSARHAGHAGAQVEGFVGETHFIVRINFGTEKLSRLEAHRRVYAAVGNLMNNPVHALNIVLLT